MTTTASTSTDSSRLAHSVEEWANCLDEALAGPNADQLRELFLEDSYWRDLASLTWDVRQFWGREPLLAHLVEHAKVATPTGFTLQADRSAPHLVDEQTCEFYLTYRTATGTGSAFVHAVLDPEGPGGLRAQVLATTITSVDGQAVPSTQRRGYTAARPGQTWHQHRRESQGFEDTEPDVLVIGGGQTGLIMASRLERLGVTYVVADRNPLPGDGWRSRYDSLALHTPTVANNLPHVHQPETFPSFVSKDEWGNYLDAYATFMNLNRWGGTEVVSAVFDETDRRWDVTLSVPGGATRILRPAHVVTAVGYTGTEPYIPDLPGLDDFAGQVMHSSEFVSGSAFAGQRVLVVGTGTSGHDIALDLSDHGAQTHLAQRGPTCVVPIEEAERYNLDYGAPGMSVEEADQRRNSMFILPLVEEKARAETQRTEREYAEMYDGLRRAGMTLTTGEDGGGWVLRLVKSFSGYYLDVGASAAIIDGRIAMVQMADVDRWVEHGLRLRDGTVIELDAVVLSTGYRNVRHSLERIFGSEVAGRVGDIGGVAENGEHRNMARPTRQPHLWLLFGGIMDARKMSEVLALQIAGQILGATPTLVRDDRDELISLPPLDAAGEEVAAR
ncbi:flavin-containing monooxygenase [Nocardioides acrostichi]|uniref:NAD(P)/FAD-dependent oxidoreductase n=1 Tax=Nocardioides acrostichi TaxID=2784339 RepID=A0A930Y8N4_9ACTN|nr:NAD(P)/FAD-dependent oxidoreductase [Nocardioides acrostichi]MBF4163297.1 NAD(P)/FAD-dependent oxidoreductase [Nocardioides acrostichi]